MVVEIKRPLKVGGLRDFRVFEDGNWESFSGGTRGHSRSEHRNNPKWSATGAYEGLLNPTERFRRLRTFATAGQDMRQLFLSPPSEGNIAPQRGPPHRRENRTDLQGRAPELRCSIVSVQFLLPLGSLNGRGGREAKKKKNNNKK